MNTITAMQKTISTTSSIIFTFSILDIDNGIIKRYHILKGLGLPPHPP